MHREAVVGSVLVALGGVFAFLLLSSVLHGPRPPQPAKSAAASAPAVRLVDPASRPVTAPGEPQPGAIDRDAERRADLSKIRDALKSYHDKNGRYPSSGGNAQTACAYANADVLCQFRSQVGGDLTFRDPSGDPQTYGYWYISDGKSYVLLASMEGAVAPEESCVPRNFVKPNLYCVQSE